MGADEEGELTYRGHCPSCGREREIYRTVPWQDDFCMECAREIDSDGTEGTEGTE
jgi:uncharacterized protein (DUF983 family)